MSTPKEESRTAKAAERKEREAEETESGEEGEVEHGRDDAGNVVLKMAQRGEFKKLGDFLDEAGTEEEKRLLAFSDEDGYTALHRASYNGRVRTMRLLLSRGADVEAPTHDGWRPLHCATRWNQLEAMELLLRAGADVNARTQGGLTPLMLAASRVRPFDSFFFFLVQLLFPDLSHL